MFRRRSHPRVVYEYLDSRPESEPATTLDKCKAVADSAWVSLASLCADYGLACPNSDAAESFVDSTFADLCEWQGISRADLVDLSRSIMTAQEMKQERALAALFNEKESTE